MNKITIFLTLWVFIISVSCNDKDNCDSSPVPAANNPGVYFDKANPRIIEMEANQNLELVRDYFVVALGRDETKTGSALQVPITINYAKDNLTIPATVTFEAGSATTELHVNIGSYDFGSQYDFSIEISADYSDPYKKYDTNEDGGSTKFDGKVEVVCLVGAATFTPTDYSGTTQPEFTPFEQKIYDNQNGTYTIKNFLYNNAGYALTFELDDENNIRPVTSSGYHSISDNRWYFYSANSDASANQIPCYIPGDNPTDNVTYIYFYTAENTTSYQDFWLDMDTQTGRMMGYSRYTVSSSGRIAFDISW